MPHISGMNGLLSEASRSSKSPKNAYRSQSVFCTLPINGEPLAQQMVVQSHPCGGPSSYMMNAFRSTEFQDSGYPHGA